MAVSGILLMAISGLFHVTVQARNEREANIRNRIREAFEKSRRTYGPDRIVMELRKAGEKPGRRRCAA